MTTLAVIGLSLALGALLMAALVWLGDPRGNRPSLMADTEAVSRARAALVAIKRSRGTPTPLLVVLTDDAWRALQQAPPPAPGSLSDAKTAELLGQPIRR
jgi:hypothetical protein